MCRALRVLCAAPDQLRLGELKRAAVGTQWELTGGATSVEELRAQLAAWRPDVVVLDAVLGDEAVRVARELTPAPRVLSFGALSGVDAEVSRPDEVRRAILGLPQPGGPVAL